MWLGFPQKMRDELINRGVETRPSGGWDYPKPVPVLMEEGGKPHRSTTLARLLSRLLGTGLRLLSSCLFLSSAPFCSKESQVFLRKRALKGAVAHAQMYASLSTPALTVPLQTTARIRG